MDETGESDDLGDRDGREDNAERNRECESEVNPVRREDARCPWS